MTASRTLSRIKLAAFHSSANVLSSVLAFANTLLAVSLTIDYLGSERFGVWMTVASVSSMLTFLDLGVGNGLVSQIAKSRASGDTDKLAMTATRGLTIMCLIGIFVGSVLTVLNVFFPVSSLLKVESEIARNDAEQLVTTFIILFSLNIPLNGIFKIMLGLQLGWIVHTVRSIGSLLTLLLVYLLARQEADPAPLLVATYGVTVLAPLVLIPFFIKKQLLTPGANKNWLEAKSEYRSLINVGGLFLCLQLGIMIGWGSDAFIISVLNSAAAVAQFAIIQRLFQAVSVPINIINAPLWGAYADAHAQGDTSFIKRTLILSLSGTLLVSTVLSLGLFFTIDWILDVWIDDHVQVSGSLVLAFAIWKVLQSVGHSFSMALNGMHIVRIQVYSVLMLCAIALPMKLVLTPTYGAAGAVWSTVIAYTLSTVLFYIVVFRRHILTFNRPASAV